MGKKRGEGRVSSSSTHSKESKNSRKGHKTHKKDFVKTFGLDLKEEIPLGIKILALYTLLLSIVYLFAAIASPVAIFFGHLIPGALGKIINFVYVAILLALAYGFVTRKNWVWKVALVWYSFAMVDALVSGFSINSYFDLLINVVITFMFFTFLANAVMLWYVFRKRTYFMQHSHPRVAKEDRVFITVIIVLVLFFLVISVLSIGKFFYDTSKLVNKVALDLKTAFPGEENAICKAKDLPERDICYLTLSIFKKSTDYCSSISSDFYKLTCYRGDILKSG